jgi:hypothetical protein
LLERAHCKPVAGPSALKPKLALWCAALTLTCVIFVSGGSAIALG